MTFLRVLIKNFILLLILFLHEPAKATYLDLNLLYFSDQFTAATETKIGRTQYDLGLGFDITKSRQLVLALDTGSSSLTDANGTSTINFTVTDLGLKLIYFLDKAKGFSFSLTYNLISTAKYNDGSTESEFRGSSIKTDFGYNFWLAESFALGIKFFYYSATFKESIANNTITNIAYKRTLIYPSLSLVYNY
jgi:hypothetical protein